MTELSRAVYKSNKSPHTQEPSHTQETFHLKTFVLTSHLSNFNMQFTNILSIAACLALAQALPTANVKRDSVDVVFHGAADAQYTLSVPLDGAPHLTSQYYPPLIMHSRFLT